MVFVQKNKDLFTYARNKEVYLKDKIIFIFISIKLVRVRLNFTPSILLVYARLNYTPSILDATID